MSTIASVYLASDALIEELAALSASSTQECRVGLERAGAEMLHSYAEDGMIMVNTYLYLNELGIPLDTSSSAESLHTLKEADIGLISATSAPMAHEAASQLAALPVDLESLDKFFSEMMEETSPLVAPAMDRTIKYLIAALEATSASSKTMLIVVR